MSVETRYKADEWVDVDRYLVDLIVRPDESLVKARDDGRAAGLPSIEVSDTQGKLLMLLALGARARRILEIGTLFGFSTIWLAKALPKDGCLVTIEGEPKHAEVARANIARAGLTDVVELREGRAEEEMGRLAAEGTQPFDFIFIDADKPGYATYFELALKLSHPGTLIFADNVERQGNVANPKTADERVQGIQRFLERVAAEPRVEATALQTVGSKGYDGFFLGVVKE